MLLVMLLRITARLASLGIICAAATYVADHATDALRSCVTDRNATITRALEAR